MRMEEFRKLVACPPTWYDTSGDEWVTTILELDWYYSLSLHAIDGDDLPFHPYQFDEYAGDDDVVEREHMAKNLAMRRGEAEKTFKSRAGRLIGLRFMRPSEQTKHFNPAWSRQRAIDESRSGTSYFFYDFESEKLECLFWTFLHLTLMDHVHDPEDYKEFVTAEGELAQIPDAVLWGKFLTKGSLRICIDVIHPIGATDGKATSLICFDIHFGAKLAHAYPVSELDARAIMGDCEILRYSGLVAQQRQ